MDDFVYRLTSGPGMKNLIGRKIEKILLEKQGSYLVFETDKGPLAYYAEGDCCSFSWFSDIIGVDFLLGHTVTEIVEVEVELSDDITPPSPNPESHDVIAYYKIMVKTDKGIADIWFRNDSNGYYGGTCKQVKMVDTTGFQEITKDFPV